MQHASLFALSDPMSTEDPLGPDTDTDVAVVTTRRGLCRIAFVAAEAAARFQRDEPGHDAVGWMLAPRRLFGGAAALDACLERDSFRRAVLLHALSLGMDASPDEIDAFGEDDADPEMDEVDPATDGRDLRLFSAVIWRNGPAVALHGFHASFASDAETFRGAALSRLGMTQGSEVLIIEGIDASSPKVRALVAPEAMASLLAIGGMTVGTDRAHASLTVVRRIGLTS